MSTFDTSEISSQIWKKYPYLKDILPEISDLPDGTSKLVFKGTAQTANGQALSTSVIVKVDQDGKIIQISSSR